MDVQLLTIIYLAASLRAATTTTVLLRGLLFPANTIVGFGWVVLLNWSPVPQSVRPPWTMVPREDARVVHLDEAAALRIVRGDSHPTSRAPLAPLPPDALSAHLHAAAPVGGGSPVRFRTLQAFALASCGDCPHSRIWFYLHRLVP